MHKHKKTLLRFTKYVSVSASTFALDLALLSVFIDVLKIHHVTAAGAAFIIAVTINYFVARKFVFTGTSRTLKKGYAIFILIAGVGFFVVTSLMYVFVDIVGLHYLVSRVLIACVVGTWQYLMNLYVNFKVAGK